ncbi:MAG TPA: hypothetical protein VGJ21_17470, partial [Terracidiphilus sp.]
ILNFQVGSKIQNITGLLISKLALHCAPDAIEKYREQWRKEDEQEARRQQRDRAHAVEQARRILASVAQGEEWDKESIAAAKSLLAEEGAGKSPMQ